MKRLVIQYVIVIGIGVSLFGVARIMGLTGYIESKVIGILRAPLSVAMQLKMFATSLLVSDQIDNGTIEQLRANIRNIQAENTQCAQLEYENVALRQALNFSKNAPRQPIMAHIVGTSSEQDSHVLVLDKGSSDGVSKGAAVVGADGVFIGTITAIQPSVSFLLLLNDDRSNVIISIFKNKNELSGIARGKFRLGIVVEKMLQKVPVSAGDIVVTSSLNRDIPAGLLVGSIREVTSSANDLFQQATLAPALSYESLRIVGVVAK